MYVISTFEQNSYLEMAIGALQRHGIPEEHILAVPLDKQSETQRLMDTMYYSDGTSLFDAAALAGTFFGALGTIVGYSLPWGPIAWGIIGFLFGGVLGFYIDYLVTKKRRKAQPRGKVGEVVLTVYCRNEDMKMVEDTLWEHFALGVGRLNHGD